MVKKSLSLAGCVLNLVLAGVVLVWIAAFGCVPNTMGVLIADLFVLVFSVVIGKVFLKLSLDKLLLKIEISGASKWDKIVLNSVVMVALCVVCFEITTVAIYFFKGVKMEQVELVRFIVLPILSLAHLALGAGSYLAYEYCRNYA